MKVGEMTGELKINPAFNNCQTVDALVAQHSRTPIPVLPREQTFRTQKLIPDEPMEEIWSDIGNPGCKLML
jgi:hypothetical protein